MKFRTSHLFFVLPAAMSLTACNSDFMSRFSQPLAGGNALDPPGYRDSNQDPLEVVEATGPLYSPGQWVETSVPSAAFYQRLPNSNDQPSRSLALGTPLKVVSMQGTYAKVELESGAIGFVPAIMVSQKASANEIPILPSSYGGGLAPEPEIAPLSVQDAEGAQIPIDRIDPTADDIE